MLVRPTIWIGDCLNISVGTHLQLAAGPWKLVYTEQFETLIQARHRELEIKRWKSAKMIQSLIRGSVG